MSDPLPNHATVIFDGTCGFCTLCVRLMGVVDPQDRLVALPCQQTRRVTALGVTSGECAAAAWVVTDAGERFGGAQAVLAAIAIARRWPWLLTLGALPVIRHILAGIYHVVSSIRPWLPGDRPWCDAYPDQCQPGR
jgi:predicted DCC family thiol-disulfide oxidoreductase YuxK